MGFHVAIVTGGARGIGRQIAVHLARRGVPVAVFDIDPGTDEAAADIAATATGSGAAVAAGRPAGDAAVGTVRGYRVDVSDVTALRAAVEQTARSFGPPLVLVNNAGILHSTPVEEVTEAEWDRVMAVNLKSAFFASQAVLPSMKEARWGRIVGITSLAGRMGGYANGLAYSASKAGLIGLTRGLARRVAGWGITVNAVAPGTTETDIIAQFSDEKREELRSMIPVGRLGRPSDVASLVEFLVSDEAEFVTGAVIDVNGGMYMG